MQNVAYDFFATVHGFKVQRLGLSAAVGPKTSRSNRKRNFFNVSWQINHEIHETHKSLLRFYSVFWCISCISWFMHIPSS